MTEPTTAAGKRLLGYWASHSGPVEPKIDRLQSLVAAIEREAVAAALARVRERVHERIDTLPVWDRRTVPGGKHVLRRFVHLEIDAILDEEAATIRALREEP